MKTKSVLLLCALTTFGAFAQKSVVDEVDNILDKMSPDYKSAAEKIVPALTNDETKSDAKTWFLGGKANFGIYDQEMVKLQLGQAADSVLMSNALLKGYDYFKTALPLDTVKQVDKKGQYKLNKDGSIKVKTKYSKDIVNLLMGHHNDFSIAGNLMYNKGNYKEAGQLWDVYVKMPYSGIADRDKFAVPDSTVAEMAFFEGVALWQGEDLKGAIDAFAMARKLGYQKKEAYDYALSCMANLQDTIGIVELAKEANKVYGKEDSQYIKLIINDNINHNQYDEAQALIESAIAGNPNSADLYNLMGFICEQKKDDEQAFANYKKATELDPNFAPAQFNAGACIVRKAAVVREKVNKLTGAEYQNAINNELMPLYREALPYIEKAYELDNTDMSAKRVLSNLYYQLGDEAKLNALEGR